MAAAQMCVFHHNMRVFSGGSNERTKEYGKRYDAINRHKIQPIVVGFTEVTNDAHDREIHELAEAVSGLAMRCLTFWSRQTAVKKQDEYIAIGWSKEVTVDFCGICFYDRSGNGVSPGKWVSLIVNPNQDQPEILREPPKEAMPDQQGVAFIAGRYGKAKSIFAFAHNVYHVSEKSVVLNCLAEITNSIFTNLIKKGFCENQGEVGVVLGGDWNATPSDYKDTKGVAFKACYAKSESKRDRDGEYMPLPTTLGEHCYDYWYINQTLSQAYGKRGPDCKVHSIVGGTPEAMEDKASDHLAITINLPLRT
jgi:hypothetical protein